MNDPDTVVIATATQTIEATQLQMQLDSCGIDSQLDGEMTVTIDPLLANAIGGIRVLVAEEDAEQAREIIKDYRQKEKEAFEERAKTCPDCGEPHGKPFFGPMIIGLLTLSTLGLFGVLYLLYPWPRFKCPSCGHKWR